MNKRTLLIILALILVPAVLAANPGHTAGSISPGTFNTGGAFTFPQQLNVQGNFIIDTSTFFVNTTSGNVGIGTTNPTSRLYVEGDITVNSSSDICIEGGNCLSEMNSNSINGSGTTNTLPLFSGATTLTDSSITESGGVVSVGTQFEVSTSDFIVDTNTFFVDASTNRVGIGTDNPLTALDVRGEVAVNNNNVSGVNCIVFDSGGEICSG